LSCSNIGPSGTTRATDPIRPDRTVIIGAPRVPVYVVVGPVPREAFSPAAHPRCWVLSSDLAVRGPKSWQGPQSLLRPSPNVPLLPGNAEAPAAQSDVANPAVSNTSKVPRPPPPTDAVAECSGKNSRICSRNFTTRHIFASASSMAPSMTFFSNFCEVRPRITQRRRH